MLFLLCQSDPGLGSVDKVPLTFHRQHQGERLIFLLILQIAPNRHSTQFQITRSLILGYAYEFMFSVVKRTRSNGFPQKLKSIKSTLKETFQNCKRKAVPSPSTDCTCTFPR